MQTKRDIKSVIAFWDSMWKENMRQTFKNAAGEILALLARYR